MDTAWKVPMDTEMQRRLCEAMQGRASCRSFAAAPDEDTWQRLLALAEQPQGEPSRLPLSVCEPSLFHTLMGRRMGFENATCIVGVVAKSADPLATLHAAFSAELLGLCMQEMGLGYCWVTGTYKRRETGIALESGEKLVGVMPFGVPKTDENAPRRGRRPLQSLCTDDLAAYPPILREAAQAVRIAPSAINAQPWRFTLENEKTLRIAVRLPIHRVDLGIALCHAELALHSTPHTTAVEPDGLTARIGL